MAGQRAEANYYGRLLLRELVKLRVQNGLMQAEVCKRMKYNVSKLSRIEQGQVPDWHNVAALLDIYGVTLDQYPYWENLWELSQVKGWWRSFGIGNYGYVALENEANRVYEFQMGHLPGLLQTPVYTRRVLESHSKLYSRKSIAKAIEIKRHRQARLVSKSPLLYHAVLYGPTVGPGCDKAQLQSLIDNAELANVTLQIVPSDHELHDGLFGPFTIFSFDDNDEPDIAYVEHRLGMAQTDDGEKVAAVKLAFKSILKHALSPEASIEQIRSLMT
jgi:transcriptional regulator with XRE-family HTH domain